MKKQSKLAKTKVIYKSDIAETLNCFFVDQQKNLISQIGLNNDSSTGARASPPAPLSKVSGTSTIPQRSKDKVVNLLLSIPVYKATGNDGVSAKLLAENCCTCYCRFLV